MDEHYTGWIFEQDTIANGLFSTADESVRIDGAGELWVTTDYPVVTLVTALAYRLAPELPFVPVDLSLVTVFGAGQSSGCALRPRRTGIACWRR